MGRGPPLLTALLGVLLLAPGSAAGPLCAVGAQGHDDRCHTWLAVYDHPGGDPEWGFDMARATEVSPDGATVVVAGASSSETSWEDLDYAVVAYDAATGQERWRARYAGPLGLRDEPRSLVVTETQAVVTGTADHALNDSADVVTISYDLATGEIEWLSRLDAGGEDRSGGLAVAPDGSEVYLAATSNAGGDNDILTVALDGKSGEELWRATYDGPRDDGSDSDVATGVAVDPGGERVYVTGQSRGLGGNADYDIVTLAYETADEERLGERLWEDRYDAFGLRDAPAAIEVSPDGDRLYVAGFSGSPGYSQQSAFENTRLTALAYDPSTGDLLWQAHHGVHALNWTQGLAVTSERVYIAGVFSDPDDDRNRDPVTVAFSAADGAELWSHRFGLPGFVREEASDVGVSPSGNVYVTGSSSPQAWPSDLVTISYRPDGTVRWVARHNSMATQTGIDYGSSIAVSPVGEAAYTTGTFWYYPTPSGNRYDIGTLAYR